MDIEKKTKKIICGEYLIFAVVAAVLSALILTRVWILGQSGFRYVFIYFTLALGAWFVIDLFWTIFSKNRGQQGYPPGSGRYHLRLSFLGLPFLRVLPL